MSASSIWNATEADFPANGSKRDRLAFSMKYASFAPTQQAWKSWEFQVADTFLELFAKDGPALVQADPEGRDVMIGCGSALHHLKIAMKHFG